MIDEGIEMSRKTPTWEDLIWSRDPKLLTKAAVLAEQIGRASLAEALLQIAERIEDEADPKVKTS